jgi:hypothetical protein
VINSLNKIINLLLKLQIYMYSNHNTYIMSWQVFVLAKYWLLQLEIYMYFYKYQTKSQYLPIQNPIIEFKKVQKSFLNVLNKRMWQKQVEELVQNCFQKQNSNPIIN